MHHNLILLIHLYPKQLYTVGLVCLGIKQLDSKQLLEQWQQMMYIYHITFINALWLPIVINNNREIGSIIVRIVSKDIIGYGTIRKRLLIIHNALNLIKISIVQQSIYKVHVKYVRKGLRYKMEGVIRLYLHSALKIVLY